MKVRKPRLTDAVLEGLNTALSEIMAGDIDDMVASGILGPKDPDKLEKAEQWVTDMYAYRTSRKAER